MQMRLRLLFVVACLAGLVWPSPAQAEVGAAASYALVVGSNRGGAGQKELRYARSDATRVRALLLELGGFAAERTEMLLDPDRAQLTGAFSRIHDRLKTHAQRGENSRFLFYYSGHARARALNLGAEELDLETLRTQLAALPSTVSVVILDACQSGAISRVKGAAPAADFSLNSVNRLNTRGLAVMASSSGTELSQETDALQSSYFTHHLLVALRGAADQDSDGNVTLSEAYRYAYHRTLVATAGTAVGKQHVTLETQLRGKGEMVLSRPTTADAALELPSKLSGQLLVHRIQGNIVVAELHKAPHTRVRLALPAGRYVALVRLSKDNTRRCEFSLTKGRNLPLRADACPPAPVARVQTKGGRSNHTRWALELGVGGLWGKPDGYNATLENFGFDRQGLFQSDGFPTMAASLLYTPLPYLSLVLGWTMLDRFEYRRDMSSPNEDLHFSWSSHAIGLYARGQFPLAGGVFTPYAQAGFGFNWASTEYIDPNQASIDIDDETQWGWHFGLGLGFNVMPWRHFGFYAQGAYLHAPTPKNLLGEWHNSGGLGFHFGLRGAL